MYLEKPSPGEGFSGDRKGRPYDENRTGSIGSETQARILNRNSF